MLHGQTAAEGGLEPPYHLRCQADLRHQDQCAAAQLQRALDKPQKHNGLAAAGYAVQQCRVGSGILQIRQQIVKNLLLFRDSSSGCGSNGMAANRSMALSCSAAVSTPF